MALLDNLVAYYKLDEASGSALDAHGANHLSQVGSVGTAAGKVGTARDFPGGGGSYFTRVSNADLQTGDIDFTVACWFQMDSFANFPPLLQKEKSGTTTFEWQLFYFTGQGAPLQFRVQDATPVVSWPAALATATWYHVVAWHDSVNNTLGICVNAGTPTTASYSGGITVGTEPFRIGGWPVVSRSVDGRIDEVGFWKRILTATERAQLYNGGAGLAYESFAPPPPVTYAPVIGSAIVYPDLGRVG